MFGLGFKEVIVIAIVIMILIKPEDLPNFFNKVGKSYASLKQMIADASEIKDSFVKMADVDIKVDSKAKVKTTVKKAVENTVKKAIMPDIKSKSAIKKEIEVDKKEIDVIETDIIETDVIEENIIETDAIEENIIEKKEAKLENIEINSVDNKMES